MSSIEVLQLDCGMPLIVESMTGVASAAMMWYLPGGAATDPMDGDGYAALLSELIFRGAGSLNSREHSEALDRLGVRRSATVGNFHLRLSTSMLGSRLSEGLPLLVDVVRRPLLPEDALEPARSLCLQSLASLEDEPNHLVMLRLRERHLPPPFNRSGYGRQEVFERATIDELRRSWTERARPVGSVLAFAGDVDAHALATQLNDLLAGWTGTAAEPKQHDRPQRGYVHVKQETSQVHLGIAYDAPPESDQSSMRERLAVAVLSGSTSGRLFTEVRQKRSLCYSVGATYRAGRDRGRVTCYAGTTPQRAQETMDVCLGEIARLREGVTPAEFRRAAIGLRSHLIMQGESTPARAGALAYDWFRLGQPRSLDELSAQIDAVTINDVNDHLGGRDFGEMTFASIGPDELNPAQPETPKALEASQS